MEPVGRFHSLIVCSVLLGGGPAASAQGAPDTRAGTFSAHASVPAPIASGSNEDATAAATTVEVADRAAAGDTVADVLTEVPGARPYRTGTLGSFTAASLRGAEVEHTTVLLGDLPISGADAAAFDLSSIPTALVERVVVYRGGAPVWLGQGAIGGVVQLIPRQAHAREMSATATVGSFGLWGLSADSAVVSPQSDAAPSVYATAGITGAEGDFEYRYDNGTVLDPADDYDTRRRNADALDAHGLLYLRQPAFGGHLDVVALGFERVAGEPASPADPAFRARRNLTRAIGMASWEHEEWSRTHRLYRVQVLAGGGFQRARFTDLFSEVGTSANRSDDLATRSFGRFAWSMAAAPWLEATALATVEHEKFDPEDQLALVALPDSVRDTVTTAAELNFRGRVAGLRSELRPSVRFEHTGAQLHAERFRNLVETEVEHAGPTYRVAGVVEPVGGLALGASAATGQRVPSMLELFGDGALLAGNTGLRPERATLFDIGLVARGALGAAGGSAELRAFRTDIDNLVVWTTNSLREAIPLNLRRAEIVGLEFGLRGNAGRHVKATVAATLLDSEGKPGKEVPGRARYAALVRPEVETGRLGPLDALGFFVELRVVGPSHDDPDNVASPSPTQIFFDSGASLFAFGRGAQLRLTARDLFDRAGYDLRGFQLPGRTFVLSLDYKENV